MSSNITRQFVEGAISMGLLIGSGFFFRFWRESRDRLFMFFALSLLLQSLNRAVGNEDTLVPYLIRVFAYAIIIIGIVDKNLRRI